MLERRDFEITRHETPIDKKAALVVSKGFQYQPEKKIRANDSDFPIPVEKNENPDPNFKDLTGIRFGRLKVIGKAANRNKRWVCRCDCGKYTVRTTKAVKNPENYGDRCDLCQHHAYLVKKRIWQDTGKDIDVRDI